MNNLPNMAGNHMDPELLNLPQNPTHQFINFQASRFSIPQPEYGCILGSPSPLNNALTTLTLKEPLCHLCKGRKYNFTAYFHNKYLFPSPPHHLLGLAERSYILKNSLQSLLVTYVLHEFEQEHLQAVRRQIEMWGENVDFLVNEVVESADGFQVELGPLGNVKTWTKEMMIHIWDHASGMRRMEMPRGRCGGLLLEFRKLWERVWLGYLEDQVSGRWERDSLQETEI